MNFSVELRNIIPPYLGKTSLPLHIFAAGVLLFQL